MRFKGKVAIVTGGTGEIGRATALQLASEGAKVLLADLGADGGKVAAELSKDGREVVFFEANVCKEPDVMAMVKAATERWGRLDVMVSNAGVSGRGRTNDTPLAEWERILGVNLTGVFLCAKHAHAAMKASGGGAIVNTASIMGLVAVQGAVSYASSKGAVVNMTRATALDYAKDGIRVNAVCPGFMESRMKGIAPANSADLGDLAARHPLGRLGKPSEVAKAIAFLASDDASFITGHSLLVDGGYVAQ
jgi:NAD(P)-dependent dehydrogenase (short-subunit alcohol dehydrogenase family)